MIYDLSNEYDLPRFAERVKRLAERKAAVELRELRPRRSLAQNNYLHVILSYFASQYGCSADYAKSEVYKKTCNPELYVVRKTNKRGEEFEDVRSSADLTTEEMTLSIERFRNWAAVGGIYIASPDDHRGLLFMEKEIERNKEFV
jgi:hypothetical protein